MAATALAFVPSTVTPLSSEVSTTLTVGEITYHLTTIPISAVMRLEPPVVAPNTPLAEAAGLLRDESVGVLPVVEDGRLVGLLGARDLIALLAAGGPQGW